MQVGDLVRFSHEGIAFIESSHLDWIPIDSAGIIVKKYIYEEGDDNSNGQYVYDVMVLGRIAACFFKSELVLAAEAA